MADLRVVYRISDKGRDKEKLANATKQHCLENAIATFGKENLYVIADNCSPELISIIEKCGVEHEETSLGNIGSFKYALDKVVRDYPKDSYVYLLEDDYLHLPDSKEALLEGLAIADYVTLYDHADQYWLFSEGGTPFNNKRLHRWRFFCTKTTHWRETPSTTMTEAAKVETLTEDYSIWMSQPEEGVPSDFTTFVRLTKQKDLSVFRSAYLVDKAAGYSILHNILSKRKKRLLISSIPGMSTHAEVKFLSPAVDWTGV